MPWRATMAEMLARSQMDMTVLERQQMRLRSQQQQQQVVSSSDCGVGSDPFGQALELQQLMQMEAWQDAMLQYRFSGAAEQQHSSGFTAVNGSSMATNCLTACPRSAEYASSSGFRKRKAEDPILQSPLVVGNVDGRSRRDSSGDKRVKSEGAGGVELHLPKQEMQPEAGSYSSKGGRTATTTSGDNSRQASEVVQKPDYVHVRARRGQATDSHSLAERARREKISERMKYLQDLVPGCNKIAGKAGMLDEIINYVQSLQRQVEFLSMKLAAANPVLDFAALEFSMINKESMSGCAGGIPVAMVMPPDLMVSPCVSPTSMTPQTTAMSGGLGLALNLQEITLSGASGDPVVPLSDFDMDASSFNVAGGGSSPAWDANMQSLLFASLNQAVTSSVNPIGELYQNAT